MCLCVLSCFSCVQLFTTLWTIACQAPLSMGFSRQEYWSGLIQNTGSSYLPNPGIELTSVTTTCVGECLFFFSLPLALSGRRRQWHPNPGPLPGKSHGRRSLVGCGPWGHEEWDMTKRLHFHFSLLCIGEGNGNPLQCSCLENPRDGVAQSRTQLE